MLKLRDGIIELYKKVATSLPPDIEAALRSGMEAEEEGSEARSALENILGGTRNSRLKLRPLCLDIGVPVFYVSVPRGLSHASIQETIMEATRVATEKIPLSTNAVDFVTATNSGDNTGIGFPAVHLKQSENDMLTVDLALRCAECEGLGRTYRLPDKALGAERDLEGLGKCVLDAVKKSGGRGCSPYVIGVGAGPLAEEVTSLSRAQLMRKLPDRAELDAVAELEDKLLKDINALGIGPRGKGGRTTALAVKIGISHRLPNSCLVDVALNCWAMRRGRLIW